VDAAATRCAERKEYEKTSRRITFGASELLEITVPVRLDGKIVGFARLGLNRESSDRILKENRNRMIISMISLWQ